MVETTNVKELVLNVLTEDQYNEATIQDNELYLIKNMDNSEVFVATYGSTTFDDITDAINKKKVCICQNTTNDDKIQYGQLVIIENNAYYFEASSSTENISKDFLKITSDNIWTSQNVEVKINSTTEISNSSTNEEFPTAAASYNFVNDNYLSKTNPTGTGVLSLNRNSVGAIGEGSVATGINGIASGYATQSSGKETQATGKAAHAEGYETIASGDYGSHAEGYVTIASGENSHSEGANTTASGECAHAEGYLTKANSFASHSEGHQTIVTDDSTIMPTSVNVGGRSGQYGHAEGYGTVSNGDTSHAEGNATYASGQSSHAEGTATVASGQSSHAEGEYAIAFGNFSHAEGTGSNYCPSSITPDSTNDDIITKWENSKFGLANGNASHVEGRDNLALGDYSHAEGNGVTASRAAAHAEGRGVTASGEASHAEGESTTANGQGSHTEGYLTKTTSDGTTTSSTVSIAGYLYGSYAHAEGINTIASGVGSHAEGNGTTSKGNQSHAGGFGAIASGSSSFAHGGGAQPANSSTTVYTTSSGVLSTAFGAGSIASGDGSYAEGILTTASGLYSHAEGNSTTASNECAHAAGYYTKATNFCSYAEGCYTTASGEYSHAAGNYTTALNNQFVIGHYNNTSTATAATDSGTGSSSSTNQSLFVIGNGTSGSTANAFRVNQYGKAYCKTNYSASGADYAEYFEWEDGNLNNEDRRGYFVTLEGKKIKIAKPSDYILGIVSAMPAIIGNGDEDWMNRYITDEFGAFVYEEFEYKEEIMENDNISTIVKTGLKHKENPNYDPTIPYIPREDRPEWDAIGMMGVLAVRDDGSCLVNEYCQVAEGGIASYAINGYRVIERVNDHVVKIIFK